MILDGDVSVVASLVGSATGGAVFIFIQFLGKDNPKLINGLLWYPVGLLLGMMWIYAEVASKNLSGGGGVDPNVWLRALGVFHLLGVATLTVCTLWVALPKFFK